MAHLMRDQVFISYAHEDAKWLDEFLAVLRPAQARGLVKVWSDREIRAGEPWTDKIRDALDRARVGILLVTTAFLNSAFIRDEELRQLLGKSEQGEVSLYWVPISATLYEYTELRAIQAASDPATPLEALPEPDRRRLITSICRTLLDELGQLPSLTRSARASLRERVNQRVGDKYEVLEEVGSGSSSICYRARDATGKRMVAVKTLVTSVLQPGIEEEFLRRLEIACGLEHPAYVRVFDHFLDEAPHCVVMEYVEGMRLDRYLDGNPAVPSRRIRAILVDLATALAEAHRCGYLHEGLTPNNVWIDADHRPRTSAFRFFSLGSGPDTPAGFFVDRETVTYMSPEQFEGESRSQRSDQYALGLLGYELLSGKRLERITCAADFVERPALYRRLAEEATWGLRSPALGGIVSRMLRVDPEERWKSLDEIAAMLGSLVIADSDADQWRSTALTSYSRLQFGDGERRFNVGFYQRLFELAPDVKEHFEGIDMTRQGHVLNRAIKVLVDWDSSEADTQARLEDMARRHERFALAPSHLDAFRRALLRTLRDLGEVDAGVLHAWDKLLATSLEHFGKIVCGRPTAVQ